MTRKRVDANQPEIVRKLHGCGVSAFSLASLGKILDLIVGWQSVNYLIEIKIPGRRKCLTPAQKEFWDSWKGQKAVCETFEEILETIGYNWKGKK